MRISIALIILISVFPSFAQTKVVVIPLGGSDFKPLQNVVTVGLKNADFTNPINAISSIPLSGPQAPSTTNPYLVVIGPGVYELQRTLVLPSHVSIAGSGRRATILQFDLLPVGMSSGTAVFLGRDLSVSDLSIQHTVASGQATALTTKFNGVILHRIDVLVSGSRSNVGILSRGGSMQINDVVVSVQGGNAATGISLSDDGGSRLNNVLVDVGGSSGNNIGIDNNGASPTIVSSSFTAKSGIGSNIAIRNTDSSPNIFNSQAIALSGSGTSIGIENIGESFAPNIQNSAIRGSSAGISLNNEASKVRVTSSRIIGGVMGDVAGTQCRDNYDAVLNLVEC